MTTLTSVQTGGVFQQSPTRSYANHPKYPILHTGSSRTTYMYVLFGGVPSGPAVRIESALLKFWVSVAWSGSSTIEASQVTSTWSPSSLTWNRMTAGDGSVSGGATASVAVSSPTKYQLVTLDVTTIAQAWASGAANYGVRISASGTDDRGLFPAGATGKDAVYKPVLDITYSTKPAAPTGLSPAFGQQVSVAKPTLTWPYADQSPLQAIQVQVNTSDSWGSPAEDSGELVSQVPQYTVTNSVSDGTTRYWRARVKNQANQWSDWSQAATFGYTAKPTFSITSPSDDSTVNDVTPPVLWSALSAGTQKAWELRMLGGGDRVIASSGIQAGALTSGSLTTPIPVAGVPVDFEVRLLDTVDRADTPGDSPWISERVTVTYGGGTGHDPVTNLKAMQTGPKPFIILVWKRDAVPDGYTIFRDGRPIAQPDPGDLWDGVDGYTWVDTTAAPHQSHTYVVAAVVNDVAVESSPVSARAETYYIWLIDPDDTDWWLALADQDSASLTLGDSSVIYDVRGSDRKVLIAAGLQGYEGTVSGGLYTDLPGLDGLTAADLRDRVWRTKIDPTHVFRLVIGDMNIPVVVRNVNVVPTSHADVNFAASFEAYQQGELPWS